MKRRSVHIAWKRFKQISKLGIFMWLMLGFFSLLFLIQLFLPPYRSLDGLQEVEIHISNVSLFDSGDKRGSRMKLTIADGDDTYYLWYPQTGYKKFRHAVETELLTGKTTLVTAKIVSSPSLRDKLQNKNRMVDLRSGDSVYYDIDTEKKQLTEDYVSVWIAFPLLFFCWAISTLLIGIIYRPIVFQRK